MGGARSTRHWGRWRPKDAPRLPARGRDPRSHRRGNETAPSCIRRSVSVVRAAQALPRRHSYRRQTRWVSHRMDGVLHVSNPRPTEPRSNAPTKLCPVSGSTGTRSRAYRDSVDNRAVRRHVGLAWSAALARWAAERRRRCRTARRPSTRPTLLRDSFSKAGRVSESACSAGRFGRQRR